MAALVTQTPILIDGVNFSRQDQNTNYRMLFRRGTTIYLLLRSQLDQSVCVYKSTDEGQTWTLLDAANNPGNVGDLVTYDDVDGDTIGFEYTIFVGPTPFFVYQEFSTATDTYGTPSNHFSLGGLSYTAELLWKQLDGTPVLIIQRGTGHYVTTYSAGAWSAASLIYTAGSSSGLFPGFRDAAGTYHATIEASATVLQHLSIDNSLTASAPTTIYTVVGGTIAFISRLIQDGVNIRGALVRETTLGVFQIIGFTGTPLATPSFSSFALDTAGASRQYSEVEPGLDKDGNWVLFWILLGSVADEIHMATFNGTSFNASVLFYDAVTNPPPNVAMFNFVHTLEGTQFSDATWIVSTAMETTDLSGACTGFILSTAVSMPTLACPVGGGTGSVGVAYSKSLVETGGTGPFAYAIIAGSLPPGLTLNTSTGLISGTPTTVGLYPYTAQVTDANSLTATADCEIDIDSTMTVGCPPAGHFTVGAFYYSQIVVTGGLAPFTYAIISGSLPTGLSLDTSTGVVSGTPTVSGSFGVTFEVTDALGQTADTASCPLLQCTGQRSLL